MRSAFRFDQFPFRFYAIGIAALILSQLLLKYQDLRLPGWLRFTQSATGAFATELLALLCFLAFAYFSHRQIRTIEGVSRGSVVLAKWMFCGLAGLAAALFLAVQLIPFDVWIRLTALCTSG
ncbi:MAG: hypothetical protein JF625_17685 [Inquilinus limosus]|uniref:Uncharacterized protein n=1 Tax=Inquilinus limosus TaxID=171674 RepID=A0A952FLM9_9PROT|nr:hypothetical protein [Inquilinus limosus]